MAEKKTPANKAPVRKSKRKKLVGDSEKGMLQSAVAEVKAARPAGATEVVATLRKMDLGKDLVRFIERVTKSGGFSDERSVIVAMLRMSKDSARTSGPRYFGPRLKRFSK